MAKLKRLKKLNLNVQLIAVFFAAVLLLSIGHFFLYAHLLSTMQREEDLINAGRMENVQLKLETVFTEGEKAALEIITSSSFQALAGAPVDENGLLDLERQASELLDDVEHASRWFIMIEGSKQLITNNGCCDPKTYFDGLCVAEGYDGDFWTDCFLNAPGRHYYPAAEFHTRGTVGKYERLMLMPMAFQSYYDRQLMVVLLLDIPAICQEDTYLAEGAYFFSQEGQLLYTTDPQPVLTQLPQGETLTAQGEAYAVKIHDSSGGPVCVKLQKESEAASMLRQNFVLCIAVAVAALVVIAVLVPTIVKTLLTPVDKMVNLVRKHTGPETHTDLHGVSRELEQIIQSREQQAVDLAQKNAELSEYRLHSRLKNVYVDMKVPEDQSEGQAYLLYIQTQYRDKALESFTIPRAELENCLQEMMASTLEKLFATVVLLQTEQGRFAARVALPEGETDPKEALCRFMERLDYEKEFAYFTVVCSDVLEPGTELASVYDSVRAGLRLAKVGGGSQFLRAGKKDKTSFVFLKTDEQRLDEQVRQGKIPQAAALAERVLRQNVDKGISHAQMEILCVAVVNTAAYAAVETGSQKTAAASVVYNTLATRCLTPEEYIETVAGYIRSMENAPPEQVADEDQLLGRIQKYLQENYHKEFSSEEMAAALWVSRSYLSSYYKGKTGKNISDSIQEYRIGKATELLLDPDVKIGDVGAMVGISSPNTFLRQFRKYTGMTPKEYRQKHNVL